MEKLISTYIRKQLQLLNYANMIYTLTIKVLRTIDSVSGKERLVLTTERK